MPRLTFALPLLMLSACGSCAGDDDKPSSTEQTVTTPVTYEGGARGGSRFAKPFVPGQPGTMPERRDE
jgi:hypothetical protein